MIMKNKRGQLASNQIAGVGGLVLTVIIIFLFISVLKDSGINASGGIADNLTAQLEANLSQGVQEVSNKIPVILKIIAIVLLFGVLAILWVLSKRMGVGGGAGSSL